VRFEAEQQRVRRGGRANLKRIDDATRVLAVHDAPSAAIARTGWASVMSGADHPKADDARPVSASENARTMGDSRILGAGS